MIKGRVHSLQSMGTLDGPGVRFVVFMQGCPLRCGCCHNPDTWDFGGGTEYSTDKIVTRVLRCREYFGKNGGITVSGGEPLLQAEFVEELFSMCHKEGINTCLDTSGIVLDSAVASALQHTDRVLLDLKYPTDELYRAHVGCSISAPLDFLNYLNKHRISTTLRQVTVPTLTDNEESINFLKNVARGHPCVDKIELLPFKKICSVKYDSLGIPFPFADLPTPDRAKMAELEELLGEYQ